MEQHLKWMQGVSQNIDNAYDVLCYYEEQCNGNLDDDEQFQIMKLLETVSEIHKAAQALRSVKDDLQEKENNMQTQITLLESAIEMLQLEKQTKAVIL